MKNREEKKKRKKPHTVHPTPQICQYLSIHMKFYQAFSYQFGSFYF